MTTVLSVNWSDVLAMSGMGFGVVFCVLLLLVVVMVLLGSVVQKIENVVTKHSAAAPSVAPASSVASAADASEEDKAAIAMALYLHFHNVHDEESHVITIHHKEYSAWHHELNQQV